VKTLDSLRPGDRARVAEISGEDAIAIRLMEMGLVAGAEIEHLGAAPLGDPVEFMIRGYRLSLRRSEAQRVQVQ
jgi:ferrous iron transport protein A